MQMNHEPPESCDLCCKDITGKKRVVEMKNGLIYYLCPECYKETIEKEWNNPEIAS